MDPSLPTRNLATLEQEKFTSDGAGGVLVRTTAVTKEEIQIIDEVSDSLVYIGLAAPGSSQASPVWKIKRVMISGGVTEITFAGGRASYESAWNDRASLSYS